jgi:prepilin-type N-terminal cleavage/methylation domain-containing protein
MTTFASSRDRGAEPSRCAPGARSRQAGFTILELMVVTALIVLVMGTAVYGLRDVGAAHVRAEAYRMSAALRYLYEKSITDGVAYRLNIDIDKGRIEAERLDDEKGCGGGLELTEGAETRFKDLARKAEEARKKKAEENGVVSPKGKFGAFSDFVIKGRDISKAVKIRKVATLASPSPIEEGKAFIHVFPHGVIERAMVIFEGDDEQVYSVVTEPYQGRARVLAKAVERGEVFR